MNATPADCEAMVQMASSPILIVTLFVSDLCCIVAIPLLIYWTRRIWNMKLMHFNTRLLLCFHLICLLVHVVGRTFLHTTDLILYLKPFDNGCQILHTKAGCFYLRLPFNISLIISNCTAIFVSIERLVATLKTKTYEFGYENVGYSLVLLQVTLGSCLLGIIYSQTKLNLTPLYYCQTTSRSNFMWTIYPFCAMLAMQLLAVFIFEFANRKNKCHLMMGADLADLSSRYQIEENSWTIKLLKVYVYTNVTFTAAYLLANGLVIFNNHLFSIPIYYAVVDGSNCQYLYALVLPMVLWYHRKNVHSQIRSAVDQSLGMDYNTVFIALRNQWDNRTLQWKMEKWKVTTPSSKISSFLKDRMARVRMW